VKLRLAPRHEPAVEPDKAIAIVERQQRHDPLPKPRVPLLKKQGEAPLAQPLLCSPSPSIREKA
jgi:hypothetical protein